MYYFLMTSLFHDWTFEPLNLLDLFAQSPTPLPSGNHWFVLCVYESVFVLFFSFIYLVFLVSMCK